MVIQNDPEEGNGSPTGRPNDPRPPSKPFVLDREVFRIGDVPVNGWACLGVVGMIAFIVFV